MSSCSFVRSACGLFLLATLVLFAGCSAPWGNMGGADEFVVVHMPFKQGFKAQCTQGVGGSYSHRGSSTKFDLDFDTPNNRDETVFAPVSGTAFVHDNPKHGFGRHVNIALGDGTYIVLGHLSEIFVSNGTDVGLGQLIAFEGSTGYSSGDHVHMGRHLGDAGKTADLGQSIDTLAIIARDESTGMSGARRVRDYVCSLSGGRTYASELPDVRSHPDGTLVISPYSPDVFLLSYGRRHLFESEEVFWSHGYSFADVALVSDEELQCYPKGSAFKVKTRVRGAYDGRDVWLLVGRVNDDSRGRYKVNASVWRQVLASWGVHATRYADLEQDAKLIGEYSKFNEMAKWRDGTLVREESHADVYVLAGNVAFPVLNWDVFARLGFVNRSIIVMPKGSLAESVRDVGNCATGKYCVDHHFAERCGGALLSGAFSTQSIPPDDEPDTEETPKKPGNRPVPDTGETDATDTDAGAPAGSGSGGSDLGTLRIEWQTPSQMQAERVTLSGVYATGGVERWWTTLANVHHANVLVYERADMRSGDYLRFSVEFVIGSQTSWSCLAPFPPGFVQGVAKATWKGQSLDVIATGDPDGSPGCGLKVRIP